MVKKTQKWNMTQQDTFMKYYSKLAIRFFFFRFRLIGKFPQIKSSNGNVSWNIYKHLIHKFITTPLNC